MTTAYMNDMQSIVGNSSQKQGRPVLGQNNCQGQQFIVTVPSDQNINNNGGINNPVVPHNNIIYQQQQQQTYPDYSQPGLYTTVTTGGYYEPPGNPQIMNHGGETYIVHHGIMEGETTTTLPHTIRAAPASVQWLNDNYEPCEGVSLPRSTLYNHYLTHCCDAKLDPMNPASFGKLIRAVFPNLKTRRLGTRGNSQYHYQGIRIKSVSPLNQLSDHFSSSRMHANNYHHHHHHHHNQSLKRKSNENGSVVDNEETNPGGQNLLHQNNQDFLGDVPPGATEFEEVDISPENLTEGLVMDDIRAFETLYKDHCERFIEMIVNLQLTHVESLWKKFWGKDVSDIERESEMGLSRGKMIEICNLPEVFKYIRKADCSFYQAVIAVLIPDVLRPIPCSLTLSVRNFAKYLTDWMLSATTDMPEQVVNIKCGTANTLAQILRRYTSLNHLAQAARAVFQNSSQVAQMLADINKIDFNNVQEQASWVCECDPSIVTRLEQDFKKILQQQTSLEEWASWLDDAVDSALGSCSVENFVEAAKRFLVNWSYYSSLVIRDLTLRSAASFGSFHLIHLLYNEYIFYLIERKVARVTGENSISLMCPTESEKWKFLEFCEEAVEEKREVASSHCEKTHMFVPSITLQSSTPSHLQLLPTSSSSSFLSKTSSMTQSSPSPLLFGRGTTSSSNNFNSVPSKTVTIAIGGQKPSEVTKMYPPMSGTRMTLVSTVQQSSPKTIIVMPVSSSSSLNHTSSNIQLVSLSKHVQH